MSGISSVGASLLATGSAPDPTPAKPASTSKAPSKYETEYQTLQRYDNAELLYASFLPPDAALANADSVLNQAAVLLGSPGHPGTLATGASPTIVNTLA